MTAEYYEVKVNVNGLKPGDIIWFTPAVPKTTIDLAAIRAGFYQEIEKPEWLP